MSAFIHPFLRVAGALFASALFVGLPACKQPPSPPYRAEGTEIGIVYASFYWKTENDFKRISEYFTDEENPGNNVTCRSIPEAREGLYLILNLEPGTTIPTGSVAELRYFHPEQAEMQTRRWELPEFNALPHRELRLGLTGTDWTLSKKRPSAWRLAILSPDGRRLVERESYLWAEHPL